MHINRFKMAGDPFPYKAFLGEGKKGGFSLKRVLIVSAVVAFIFGVMGAVLIYSFWIPSVNAFIQGIVDNVWRMIR